MIPKVIHYIWLSDNPLDKLSQKCVQSWHKVLSDYEIIHWNYDKCKDIINDNAYAREAWDAKKYAFVSDYLRMYILYHEGGIYMDADVEVFKPLDQFLNDKAFTCYEKKDFLAVTLVGSEKGNEWTKAQLAYYDNKHFALSDGSYDFTPNPKPVTEISKSFGALINNTEEIIPVGLHIYPKEYFCPIDYEDRKNNCFTDNTYAAHYFNAAWYPEWKRIASKLKKRLRINPRKFLGDKLYNIVIRM